jgi:hypothetical protein
MVSNTWFLKHIKTKTYVSIDKSLKLLRVPEKHPIAMLQIYTRHVSNKPPSAETWVVIGKHKSWETS